MKSIKFIILSAFVLMLIIPSCEKDSESDYSKLIIGTWKLKTPVDECEGKLRIHHNSDGTFFEDDACSEFDKVGHWEILDNLLKITYDNLGQIEFTIITLTKSEMTIMFAGESKDFIKI